MNTCSCIIQSGLGNILYKIAAAYAYSLRYSMDFKLYSNLCQDSTHAPFSQYRDTIFKNINFSDEDTSTLPVFKEKCMIYENIPNFQQSLCLYGDFQSEKYFADFKEEVKSLFCLDHTIFCGRGYCSIHVRRGDFLAHSHFYNKLEIEYYLKAISLMPLGLKYLIFSDDISWCRENFTQSNGFHNVIFNEARNPNYIDLELMSKCEHNITANSTFSWWGAYLNKNINKIIVTPKDWITQELANASCNGQLKKYMEDMLPQSWIKI